MKVGDRVVDPRRLVCVALSVPVSVRRVRGPASAGVRIAGRELRSMGGESSGVGLWIPVEWGHYP